MPPGRNRASYRKWFLKKAEFYNESIAYLGRASRLQRDALINGIGICLPMLCGIIKAANGNDFVQFTFEGECLVDVNLTVNGDYTVIELKAT